MPPLDHNSATHAYPPWPVPLTGVSTHVARQVIEKLIDDMDGGEAAETVSFALDGTAYDIDLSRKNAAALRKTFERYVKAARRSKAAAGSPRRSNAQPTRGKKPARDYDIAQLREWAGSNEVSIPSRGRIPQAVVDQYKAAGGR